MKILIDRYDPESGEKWTDTFEVERELLTGKTIMSLLDYLSTHFDPTIAYYHHSVCDHGICGRCALTVNGRVRLACLTTVEEFGELHLAPAASRTLVRDLVTK